MASPIVFVTKECGGGLAILGTITVDAPRQQVDRVTFAGRAFLAHELELTRQISGDHAGLSTTEIARTVCELLEWKRPTEA